MKYFKLYRKLIFLGGACLSLASAGSAVLITGSLSLSGLSLFAASAPLLIYGLLLLLDRLHSRYNDDLLEKITLLIEALVEQQEQIVFPEDEDTLTARLQHQLLKLRNILKAQNQLLVQEKEQIKTLISDIRTRSKHPLQPQIPLRSFLGTKRFRPKNVRSIPPRSRRRLRSLRFLRTA